MQRNSDARDWRVKLEVRGESGLDWWLIASGDSGKDRVYLYGCQRALLSEPVRDDSPLIG